MVYVKKVNLQFSYLFIMIIISYQELDRKKKSLVEHNKKIVNCNKGWLNLVEKVFKLMYSSKKVVVIRGWVCYTVVNRTYVQEGKTTTKNGLLPAELGHCQEPSQVSVLSVPFH